MSRSFVVRTAPVVLLALLAGWMTWSYWLRPAEPDEATRVAPGRARIIAGLCRADDAARAGDTATAEDQFVDVHVGLHDVAQEIGELDRAVAADLLEAKNRVESALDDARPPGFADLLVATRDAVRAVDGVDPGACP